MITPSNTPNRNINRRHGLTVNWHLTKMCNYHCRHCFATFKDCGNAGSAQPREKLHALARLLGARFAKVTLAGGEPTLVPMLPELLAAIKAEGAKVNIVTNASLITPQWLADNAAHLDLLTLSVDSIQAATLIALGRADKREQTLPHEHLRDLADAARACGIVVKVNTVVTRLNLHEDLAPFISRLAPKKTENG